MAEQAPVIMVTAPMFAALLIGLLGTREIRICFPLVLTGLVVSLTAAVVSLVHVIEHGPLQYFVAGWADPRGIGIELYIDTLNGLVLVMIGVVAILTAIYSVSRVEEETPGKTAPFYMLYLLLCTGVFGMSVTGDAFNLFVLVEVSSLTSYALIAMGSSKRGTLASFNYILMGTIGASFYLLGVGYLYMETGHLNMAAIREAIATSETPAGSDIVLVAFVLIMVGLWIKMAFFPLHGWLPNAYSYCPSSTGCILAPLMTKVSVYVMIRVILSVFGVDYLKLHLGWSHVVVTLAVIAILAGSMFALAQKELKKMLCYLIVAEVGYMIGGIYLGTHWGLVGAMYHVISDAFMTLCLFLAASIFARRLGTYKLEALDGLFRTMPWTMAGFVVGALAIIGVPPTCGFFSKWYLIRGGLDAGQYHYVAALIISSLINAVLFFRIFEIAFFGRKPVESHAHEGDEPDPYAHPHSEVESGERVREARMSSLAPLLTTAVILVLLGLFNSQIVDWIQLSLGDLGVPMPTATAAPAHPGAN